MSELSLPQPGAGTRYGASHRKSPGALAAAIALNGGTIALLIALPASQILITPESRLAVRWVELAPPPPSNPDPVEKKKENRTQTPVAQHDREELVIPDPIERTLDTITLDGTKDPGLIEKRIEPVITPRVEPHVPVLKAAARDPRYAAGFQPDYPPSLIRDGLEGSVTVRVTIDETGRVAACELVKATNRVFFEETKRQALRHWRFLPATRDGVAIRSEQVLTVTFELHD